MKKKLLVLVLSLSMVAAMMTGCGKEEAASEAEETVSVAVEPIPEEPVEEEPEEEEPVEEEIVDEVPEGMYRSELTNEPIDEALKNQRPIAVMVDNESLALPHFGLSEADVVYELMNSTLNGRITRLMCLVKDWGAIEQMGSIRSVRPTNILLAAEWNAVLCHDGGPFYIDPYLAADYAAHFSGLFSRVKNGKSTEYTEYILPGDLDKAFANSDYSKEYNKYYPGPHYQFANPATPIELDSAYSDKFDAKVVKLPFPHNKSTLTYNESTGTYDYSEYGKDHLDGEDNEILTFKNVLLQYCTFHQYDENGYMIFNCIDSGKEGYYITNGKAIKVTWTKAGEMEPTRYYDMDGNEITINTGKTYVGFVPDDNWDEVSIQ